VLAARAELGPSYDAALAESFADRVEQVVQARVAELSTDLARTHGHDSAAGQRQLALGIVSVVAGIPITIPLALNDQPGSLWVAWLGIVLVNLAHALQGRRG